MSKAEIKFFGDDMLGVKVVSGPVDRGDLEFWTTWAGNALTNETVNPAPEHGKLQGPARRRTP